MECLEAMGIHRNLGGSKTKGLGCPPTLIEKLFKVLEEEKYLDIILFFSSFSLPAHIQFFSKSFQFFLKSYSKFVS